MRGGSQSWLVQCDDDRHYVAKFLGNPQGGRTLVNELVAHPLVKGLNVLTPPLSLLYLPEDLAQHNELYFLVSNKRIRPKGLLHLGSQVPVNPDETAIFDFLPATLLSKISNLADFATMFVFGIWVYQTDPRQTIFIREHGGNGDSSVCDRLFDGYFIDFGMCFDGMHWDLRDAPLQGLGLHQKIYSLINMRRLTEEAVSKVQSISEEALLAAARTIPPSWLAADDSNLLRALIDRLRQRQVNLPLLITRHLDYLGF